MIRWWTNASFVSYYLAEIPIFAIYRLGMHQRNCLSLHRQKNKKQCNYKENERKNHYPFCDSSAITSNLNFWAMLGLQFLEHHCASNCSMHMNPHVLSGSIHRHFYFLFLGKLSFYKTRNDDTSPPEENTPENTKIHKLVTG